MERGKFAHAADAQHFAIAQDRDAIGDAPERIQIMGDDDDGQPKPFAQLLDQFVEAGGADRIEPRGRLIEK